MTDKYMDQPRDDSKGASDSPVDREAARPPRSGSGGDPQSASTSDVTPGGDVSRQDSGKPDPRNDRTHDAAGSVNNDPGHS